MYSSRDFVFLPDACAQKYIPSETIARTMKSQGKGIMFIPPSQTFSK